MSYMPDNVGLRNVTVTDAVAVSTTPVKLGSATSASPRSVIQISNPTSASDVCLKWVKAGAAAPTITATDWHYLVGSQDFSPFLGISQSIDVYAYAASPTTVNVTEMGY
jgi:hypothetical protein